MSRDKHYFAGSRDGQRPTDRDPLAGLPARFDVIVIGSGLAGLTAANILGRAGRSVLVLEQHYNLGGLATWFKRRGGHVFDISLHGFPIGMKKTVRRYWGEDLAARIAPISGVRFANPQFAFDTDFTRQDFTLKLVEELGCARETVERFYEDLARMNYYDEDPRTTGELFEEYFPGRNEVHRLLLEPISYANGANLLDPAISYGIVFSNFMKQGVYTFRGGTDRMIGAMKRILAANGVQIRTRANAQGIEVECGRVRGVRVGGRLLECEAVISNAGLHPTVLSLLPREALSAEFRSGVLAVRPNCSSTQVYMGLPKGVALPPSKELFFTSTRETFDSEALCDFEGQSRTYSFYEPGLREGSQQAAVVASMNARFKDWSELGDAAYEQAKQRLIERTLSDLEGRLPGLTGAFTHVEAATPRTFRFYTQHLAGSSFGTKFEGLRYSLALPEQVEGLYHAGSVGIIMSGWLGAANYGAITANKVDAHLLSLMREGT